MALCCTATLGLGVKSAKSQTSPATTTTAFSTTAAALTTGSMSAYDGQALTDGIILKLIADDDALSAAGTLASSGAYIKALGGTNHATTVFALQEGGVMQLKGGATIDNAANAAILNLTETTVAITGAATVSGALTVTGAVSEPVEVWADGSTTSTTATSAWYGRTTQIAPGADTVVVTYPTPVGVTAGTWFRVYTTTASTVTFTGAAVDTTIAPANATADGVSFTDIGGCVKFIATGSKWLVINESTGVTMTVVSA